MDQHDFQQCIDQAVTELPDRIREHLNEVVIVVEDRSRNLLGLYEGVPLTQWGREYSGKLPDKITLFKENIEAYARAPEEVPHVIRETLLHEIAHFLGFDHDDIHRMERKWRAKRKEP